MSKARSLSLLAVLLAVAPSCGKDGPDRLASDVTAVRIDPTEAELLVAPGAPEELQFTAWATFKDGSEEVLDLVSWSSSNLSAGRVDSSGLFITNDTNGGITEVTATHLELTSTATVKVVYEDHIVEGEADPGLVDAFGSASATDNADYRLSYPPSGATVPRNLEGLGFLWPMPEGHTVSRLNLSTGITDVSVYVEGDEWQATAEVFALVTASNRGGSVEVQVETGAWDGSELTDVVRGTAITLTVNRLDARGSVIYWESSKAAIVRIPFGTTEAEEFWTSDDSGGTCTGCHVASNESDLMVVSHDGEDGTFTVIDIADPTSLEVVVEPASDRRTTFKTLSPDGRTMIGSNKKELTIFDATNGDVLGVYGNEYPLTQPDFSPDGDYIVAIQVHERFNSDLKFEGGEVVRIPWDGEQLGEIEVVLPTDPDWNYYYPSYSPDGEWIAFNRTVGFGYSSDQAQLMLIHESGGEPIVLERANGIGELRNSYPRWGPLPDDDILWLAFSSLRTYPLEGTDLPQIWVTSVDTNLAEAGEDPSTAPFWLPGQNPQSDNHLPFWWDQ